MSSRGEHHQKSPERESDTRTNTDEQTCNADFRVITIDVARCQGSKISKHKHPDAAVLYQTRHLPKARNCILSIYEFSILLASLDEFANLADPDCKREQDFLEVSNMEDLMDGWRWRYLCLLAIEALFLLWDAASIPTGLDSMICSLELGSTWRVR